MWTGSCAQRYKKQNLSHGSVLRGNLAVNLEGVNASLIGTPSNLYAKAGVDHYLWDFIISNAFLAG